MTLTPEMRHALTASAVYCQVETRLQAHGGVRELQHLRGLSDDELERLVLRERGISVGNGS